jgi:hypothetical protein
MTSNKAYNISILCRLQRISRDSEGAIEYEKWTVLKLLNAIKEIRESRVKDLCAHHRVETDSKQADTFREWTVSKLMDALDEPSEEEEDEYDPSITRRIGCVHY